jgi:hypothetical protein
MDFPEIFQLPRTLPTENVVMDTNLPLLPTEIQAEIFKRGANLGFTTSASMLSMEDTSSNWTAIGKKEFDQWTRSLPAGAYHPGELMIILDDLQAPIIKCFSLTIGEGSILVEDTEAEEDVTIESGASILDTIIGFDYSEARCMIFDRLTTETIVSKRRGVGPSYANDYYRKMVQDASYFMGYMKIMAAFIVVSFKTYCVDPREHIPVSPVDLNVCTLKHYIDTDEVRIDIPASLNGMYERLLLISVVPFYETEAYLEALC